MFLKCEFKTWATLSNGSARHSGTWGLILKQRPLKPIPPHVGGEDAPSVSTGLAQFRLLLQLAFALRLGKSIHLGGA